MDERPDRVWMLAAVGVVMVFLIVLAFSLGSGVFSDTPAPAAPEPARTGLAGNIDAAGEEAAEVVDAAGDLVEEVGGEAVDTLDAAADTYEGARRALDRFRR